MNPVVHFEMPAEDSDRIAEFYEKSFGWQIKKLGEEMGNYILAATTETDEKGPKSPGAINGGFYKKCDEIPNDHPTLVIAVDDLNESMKKVTDNGGKVLGEPMEIPGVGTFVSFLDTEGNRTSMLQPIPKNWHAPEE